jgi:predicted PurR-regulated permease PerM
MDKIKRYIFTAFLILFIYLAFKIAQPYIVTLLTAAILAYLCYPLHLKLKKVIKKDSFSAFIVSVSIVLILILVLGLLVHGATRDTIEVFNYIKSAYNSKSPTMCANPDSWTCSSYKNIISILKDENFRDPIQKLIEKLSTYLISLGSNAIFGISNAILHLFIAVFVLYYLLVQAKEFEEYIKDIIPFKKSKYQEIKLRFKDMINGIVRGQFIISIIQGFAGWLGFFILGFSSPIFLGLLTGITSTFPIVGTPLIWAPAAIILIIKGIVIGSNIMIFKGIGLIIYGILIISSIDNILRPFVMSGKSTIHPVIIIIGILGGITLFGFFGFILGPIILSFSLLFIRIYMREFK